jgi:hydroxymethylpyrimidine/phosphomethylpyrimidine kinase
LATANGGRWWYENPRVATQNKHGTGCVLSAAIATGLARGELIEAAVAAARQFLRQSLLAGKAMRWGKGSGPAFPG